MSNFEAAVLSAIKNKRGEFGTFDSVPREYSTVFRQHCNPRELYLMPYDFWRGFFVRVHYVGFLGFDQWGNLTTIDQRSPVSKTEYLAA